MNNLKILGASERGQIESYDMMIAVLGFVLLMTVTAVVGQGLVQKNVDQMRWTQLQAEAHYWASVLVETPGIPSNWEQGDLITRIGLVNERRVIETQKWQKLLGLNYDSVKQAWNIGVREIQLEIVQQGVSQGTFGKDTNAVWSASVQRGIVYKGNPARLELRLYEPG